MTRLPQREWWAEYLFSNEHGSFKTGSVVFADSEVEAKKVAYDNAEEGEILLSVVPMEDGTNRRLQNGEH